MVSAPSKTKTGFNPPDMHTNGNCHRLAVTAVLTTTKGF
jgi:hypothetical protein